MSLVAFVVVCFVIELIVGIFVVPATGGVGCIPLIIGGLMMIGLKLLFF